MKFLFNSHVIFDADTGMLAVEEHQDDQVQISTPTRRLLLLLLSHQGEVVSREVIFKKVWDDFGMVSSNNNLNHCISKLRRILRNLGIDEDIIATVPKLGFMFHADINVKQLPEFVDIPQETLRDNAVKNMAPETVKATSHINSRNKPQRIINIIVLTLSAFALTVTLWLWYYSRPQDRVEVFIGEAGNCNVMMSENLLNGKNALNFKQGLLKYAQNLQPQCHTNEYLLIIKSRSLKTWSQDLSRLYFMRCANLRSSKAEVCWSLSDHAE